MKYLYLYDMVHGKDKRVVGQWLYQKPLSDTIENDAFVYVGKIKLEQEGGMSADTWDKVIFWVCVGIAIFIICGGISYE